MKILRLALVVLVFLALLAVASVALVRYTIPHDIVLPYGEQAIAEKQALLDRARPLPSCLGYGTKTSNRA